MLGEKLAELVSFIGEDKAEALSVHSDVYKRQHLHSRSQRTMTMSTVWIRMLSRR